MSKTKKPTAALSPSEAERLARYDADTARMVADREKHVRALGQIAADAKDRATETKKTYEKERDGLLRFIRERREKRSDRTLFDGSEIDVSLPDGDTVTFRAGDFDKLADVAEQLRGGEAVA